MITCNKIINITTIVTISGLLNIGCTTNATQKRVLTEPMSSDLEAQVLRETGISGAATGALSGAALAGGSAFAVSLLSGASTEKAATNAAVAGAAGGVVGGVAGYGEGKRRGQAMVNQAISRDKAQELLKGARAYNTYLQDVNSKLKSALAKASAESDPKTKAALLKQVRSEGQAELKFADQRIGNRKKASQSNWESTSDKSQYNSEIEKLVTRRNLLAGLVKESLEAQSPVML